MVTLQQAEHPALQQPVVHLMASLQDYHLRKSMNDFRLTILRKGIFQRTPTYDCVLVLQTKCMLVLMSKGKASGDKEYSNNKKTVSSTLSKEQADMIRYAICLKITTMHEQVLT